MKLQSKTIFVLLGTLAIGIAIGALGQSTMHNRRLEKLAEMRRQGGLYASIDRYINPVDEAQEETIRALAKDYQNKLGRFLGHYQWHRSRLMDSLKTDITPILTPEQVEQIAPWFDRWKREVRPSTKDSTASQEAARPDSTNLSQSEVAPDSTLIKTN
jgi:hypothetical protein